MLPPDVCINCYQMIKTLVFNIEGIADMQKILRIQCGGSPPTVPVKTENKKHSLLDDFAKKYSNIKLRKISVSSPEKSTANRTEDVSIPSPVVSKLVVVEEIRPKPEEFTPPAKAEAPRSGSFMCISCSEKFPKSSCLESHLKTCKASSTQQFKCFCGKVLSSKQELSNHVSDKHKQNKQQHICSTCKKVFSSLFNLQNHMMSSHKSPHGSLKGIYMCHVCKAKYPDLAALRNHRVNCKLKPIET